MKTFETWIEDFRIGEGITHGQALIRVAAAAGVSVPTVRQALRGESVGRKVAQGLSEATGMDEALFVFPERQTPLSGLLDPPPPEAAGLADGVLELQERRKS